MKVLVLMGSDSDCKTVEPGLKFLEEYNIEYSVRVCSAHRTPDMAKQLAVNAKSEGFKVIIAAAGKAAHLAGVIAAHTVLPVIGIPVKTSDLGGMDSLLSTVQMPAGVPVATVAIDGGKNAAILAAEILALNNEELSNKLQQFKKELEQKVMQADREINNK
ncbi:MAG TPA: 5-(carboxyamino)imidazole ribonucleotide mutase [Clostridia bacterium]|nr:5-(carboxyamino)imidazole ribonucleotide mutase [Clostridia bacterium]